MQLVLLDFTQRPFFANDLTLNGASNEVAHNRLIVSNQAIELAAQESGKASSLRSKF